MPLSSRRFVLMVTFLFALVVLCALAAFALSHGVHLSDIGVINRYGDAPNVINRYG